MRRGYLQVLRLYVKRRIPEAAYTGSVSRRNTVINRHGITGCGKECPLFIETVRQKIKYIKKNLIKKEGIPENLIGLNSNRERAFFSTRRREAGTLRAGMTVEAALVLPLFLFFVTAFSYFLIILSLQSDIQLAMEETARNIGKKAYFAAYMEKSINGQESDDDTAGILSAGINSLSIKALLLKDGLGEQINRSQIKGGVGGVYVYHSSYDLKSGILDIVVNYTYDIPFLPDSIGDIRFVQRCRSHVWTGKELKESRKTDTAEGKKAQRFM